LYYNEDDILKTWNRCYKGYYYEMCIQQLLAKNDIPFLGNPSLYCEWSRHTNTDYDIKVRNIKIECKLTLTKVYHSWFKRDWISRDCDIIVTNCPYHLSKGDINRLEKKNVVLIQTNNLVSYLKEKKE